MSKKRGYSLIAALLLLPAVALGATLDVKLTDLKKGYDNSLRLKEAVGPIRLAADYSYSKVEDVTAKDKGSLSVYYDNCMDSWCLWFFNIAEYNNVYYSRENYLGAGPKYYIIKNEAHKLSFSTGVLYQYDYVASEGLGRYSHRLNYSRGPLSAVAFYQPGIDDSADYASKYNVGWRVNEGLKVYCLEEYRSLAGMIDDECGLWATITIGGVERD